MSEIRNLFDLVDGELSYKGIPCDLDFLVSEVTETALDAVLDRARGKVMVNLYPNRPSERRINFEDLEAIIAELKK
jgi:hypothetical protein